MSALAAGPIPISRGLEESLLLRRALAELIPESAPDHAPALRELSLVYLEEVEQERGVVFPYDVIALAVLRVPLFVRATGLGIAQLSSVIRDCAGDFGPPRNWIAVSSFGERAMGRDLDARDLGYDTLLCVPRATKTREGDCDVRTAVAGEATPSQTLSSFLRERITRRWGMHARWRDVLASAAADTRPIEPEYLPQIVDDRPVAAPVVRVVHAKFGEGTVTRTDGDKLVIAFDAGETKTLHRDFVRPL